VFDFVPMVGPQSQIKGGGDMPSDRDATGRQPTECRARANAAQTVKRAPSDQGTQHIADEAPRQCVEQSDRGSAQQNQRGGHRHQQQVLRHVSGEQLLVQFGERRAECHP